MDTLHAFLPPPQSYVHPGVGSDNQVITFGSDKRFGLVDTGQRDMERE